MLILGIESTCDETAVAIVRDGKEILSNVIASQMEAHRPYGGVVPELASRQHLERIEPVIKEALETASVSLDQIDAIAVAQGPGLIGALLVGMHAAKGLAMSLNLPLIGVNHVEAHLYAAFMGEKEIPLPTLGVVVSGGHTSLLKINAVGEYEPIGATVDDAVGEAFDKVASLLDLPYPGGPHVEELAKKGDPSRFSFRSGTVKGKPYAFSFSGLKTNVLYAIKGANGNRKGASILGPEKYPHVAAAFQEAALSDVVSKATKAAKAHDCKSLVFGGGVTHNQRLRQMVGSELPVFWPPKGLSLDNAAMIAGLAYHKEPSGYHIKPDPRLTLIGR